MARTPKNHPEIDTADAGINQEAVNDAMVSMRDQAVESSASIFEIGQRFGALQATRMWRTTLRAAELKMFAELRSLPVETIKQIPVKVDGLLRHCGTAIELTQAVFGVSYSKLAEESQNLEALGEEVYELSSRLGLNRSALRAARALPLEKLELVRAAISDGSTKAEVMAVIEDLAEKVQKTETEVADLRAEREADEQVRGDLRKKIDKLEREKKRIKTESPDEVLTELTKEANAQVMDALGSIRGRVRHAMQALADHGAVHGGQVEVLMAGLLGQLQAEITELRVTHNLPDLSTAADAQLASEVAQWAGDNTAH
jgi:DNA repair exonuclease SbcCD ATPase subunit